VGEFFMPLNSAASDESDSSCSCLSSSPAFLSRESHFKPGSIRYNAAMKSFGYASLLRSNSNFRNLWIGQIISELGDWFNNIAVLALAMHLTGSGLVVSAVLLSRTVPAVLFGPPAGVLADRFQRRTLLLAADYLRAILAMGFLLVGSRDQMGLAYLFGALLTAVSMFFSTAKNAAIPELCAADELMTANALTGSTTAVMQMLGGALGGFAVQGFGYRAAFTLNALSFLASAGLILRIRFPESLIARGQPKERPSYAWEFWQGLRFVRGQPIVLGLLLVGMGWATGGGAAQILFSLFAIDVYRAGESGIGLLYGAAGLGIVAGATASNAFFRNQSFAVTKWVIGISMVLTGVFYSIFSFTHSLWAGMIWIALSRVVMGINNIIGATLLMNTVPSEFRGRTFSVKESSVIFTMVVSMLLAGIAQRYVGPHTIALAAGILTLLTGVLWLAANWAGVYGREVASESATSRPEQATAPETD
jgi:MFS family permease